MIAKKILIIDDDEQVGKLMVNILTKEGYLPIHVERGEMGIQAAKKNQPDMILLDVNMPEMDGFEVAKKLKNSAETRDIPFIFLTGADDPDDRLRGFLLHATDYIIKPFHIREVVTRVRSLFQRINEKLLLTSVIQKAAAGIWVFDQDLKTYLFNQEMKKITGYSPDEIPDSFAWLHHVIGLENWEDRLSINHWLKTLTPGKTHQISQKSGERVDVVFTAFAIETDKKYIMVNCMPVTPNKN